MEGTGGTGPIMTPIERETRCPGPRRFWEVALGGTWEPGERRHVESCPQCMAAEQTIRSSLGRRVPGEPDPEAISNAEAGVEERSQLEAETTGTRAPFDTLTEEMVSHAAEGVPQTD